MNKWQVATQSLRFYWRTNAAIALGVAAATAVLTGALLVGDSMRYSLRQLTLERLGQVDEMIVSDGFFREELANELTELPAFKANYQSVAPAILFPSGTVEHRRNDSAFRSGQVTVLGINESFWSFEGASHFDPVAMPEESAIINQTLADDLQITAAQVESGTAKITVRIPKQEPLPADSALGRKTDLIESLVDLTVVQIVPTEGLGRFGLHPTQSDPLNVFVPIELLQESLRRTVLKHKQDPAQANVLLLNAKGATPPPEKISKQLRAQLRPTLGDLGLTLKRVSQTFETDGSLQTIFDYWSLSSDRLVLTDETVDSVGHAFPNAKPVFTYLANDIRQPDQASGIPFSMVAAIDFGDDFSLKSDLTSQPIEALGENQIVLNRWAAEDLSVTPGDKVSVSFFEPETTHGLQVERSVDLELVGICGLTEPKIPMRVRRRGPVVPAVYEQSPTLANDPDLTPEVPGVTDAESINNWDLPFETADKIRSQDDEYWENYRTTPKAFVSLATGQELWRSRFGQTTSFRIPVTAGSEQEITSRLLDQFATDNTTLGLHLVPIKRRGLAASSGSTPFDVLFLALSMFVIGAALILVSLLFRLGLQQRAAEIGLLQAAGFDHRNIRSIWLVEMTIVSLVGAIIGILLGIGYASLMIWGLSTFWVGAISRPFLQIHIAWPSLFIGLFSGVFICVLTIWWSLRRTRDQSVQGLLAGRLESQDRHDKRPGGIGHWIALTLIVVAIGLATIATQLSGESQAGSFMGAGFLMLTAFLMLAFGWLKKPGRTGQANQLSLSKLAAMSAKRNPLRSTLTIGLVAVASFLIIAVSSFRLTPTDEGTAGFDWIAQSSQPIFDDLGTTAGQESALGSEQMLADETQVMAMRYKAGEDASCNNLYQSTQPRALGVSQQFIDYFDQSNDDPSFAWGASLAESKTEIANPWQLLNSKSAHAGTKDDPIPVIIDKNTANYSLKIYLPGTVKQVQYDSGETIYYRVVGFLANTVLQGSLIMSEQDFVSAFPSTGGYQYFLIKDGPGLDRKTANIEILEDGLSDQGFDARSAPVVLANFMSVQNTYLSTFQTLGALGLLLGTFGLAAIQVRSVLERKKELALMRAVGFPRRRLSKMVLLENAWLLLMGLSVGIGAALVTTVPHWLAGSASVPWAALATVLLAIACVGLLASWLGSRSLAKMGLLESLRV